MNKVVSKEQAVSLIKDGMILMVGGFLAVGTPDELIDELVKQNPKNLTLICNDTGFVDKGIGKMVVNKQFSTIIATHIGTNKETANQMNSGETKVILTPQGTLAEQVRQGGAGLGGFYTPTGVGTEVAENKEVKVINGKEYVLEETLRADVAIIKGSVVDKKGNIYYKGSTRNFNNLMATAADIVIVLAEELVEVGEIDPNHVMTPALFVDYIVVGG